MKTSITEIEHEKSFAMQNTLIKKCLQEFTGKEQEVLEVSRVEATKTSQYEEVKPVVLPEEMMQMAMDKTINIQAKLRSARRAQIHIEDEIRQHVEFVRIKGYERMAEIRMLKDAECTNEA